MPTTSLRPRWEVPAQASTQSASCSQASPAPPPGTQPQLPLPRVPCRALSWLISGPGRLRTGVYTQRPCIQTHDTSFTFGIMVGWRQHPPPQLLRPKDPLSLRLSLPWAQALAHRPRRRWGPEVLPTQGLPGSKHSLPLPTRAQGPSPHSLPVHSSPLSVCWVFPSFQMSEGSGRSLHPKPQPWLLSGLSLPLVFILCNEKFQQKPKAGALGSPHSPPPATVGPVRTENCKPQF